MDSLECLYETSTMPVLWRLQL